MLSYMKISLLFELCISLWHVEYMSQWFPVFSTLARQLWHLIVSTREYSLAGPLPCLKDSSKCSFSDIPHIFNVVSWIFQAEQFRIQEKWHTLVHRIRMKSVQ